ncbi:MAG: DMT family transporter [archaeon]
MDWIIFAFISAVCWGLMSIVNKKVLIHEHATEFTASRGPLIILLVLILIPFANFNFSLQGVLLTFVTAVTISIGGIFFNKSLRHGEISVVGPLTNTSPLFLLIIAYFILGEVPSKMQYIGVFLLVLGAYSLEVGVSNSGFLKPLRDFFKSKVNMFMMIAMIAFSVTATLDKFIVGMLNVQFIAYFVLLNLFMSIIYILYDAYLYGTKEIFRNLKKDYKLLAASAVLLVVGQLSYMKAVSIPGAMISLIIPIKRTSTLFSTIIGGKLFHEKNLLLKVLSSIIMIWGAVLILL